MTGHEDTRHTEIRSEKTDAHPGAILRFLLWLVFGTVVVAILLRWMFVGLASYQEAQQAPPPVMRARAERPPGPLLQEQPAQDLVAYRAAQEREIHAYGWVDRQAGIVRIDVDRAMALVAERGLPVRSSEPAPSGPAAATGKGKK